MAKPKAQKLGTTGAVDLPEAIFTEGFHGPLLHETVRAELAARRQGSASTKTRGQVRGGGKKPWRQKGTGRARIGSIRAPHWTGGGVVFGPTPRHYSAKVNRKARRRALRAALSLHAERGTVAVLEGDQFDKPSTKQALALLNKWGSESPTLIILSADQVNCAKSFRNLERTAVVEIGQIAVAELVWAASVVISTSALEALINVVSADKSESKKTVAKPTPSEAAEV